MSCVNKISHSIFVNNTADTILHSSQQLGTEIQLYEVETLVHVQGGTAVV
jgi:hypothetical protein